MYFSRSSSRLHTQYHTRDMPRSFILLVGTMCPYSLPPARVRKAREPKPVRRASWVPRRARRAGRGGRGGRESTELTRARERELAKERRGGFLPNDSTAGRVLVAGVLGGHSPTMLTRNVRSPPVCVCAASTMPAVMPVASQPPSSRSCWIHCSRAPPF
jgi:hypothetical protein